MATMPPDVRQLVTDLLASGNYESEAALIREALTLLKERDWLKNEVSNALAELDNGQRIPAEAVFQELGNRALQRVGQGSP